MITKSKMMSCLDEIIFKIQLKDHVIGKILSPNHKLLAIEVRTRNGVAIYLEGMTSQDILSYGCYSCDLGVLWFKKSRLKPHLLLKK